MFSHELLLQSVPEGYNSRWEPTLFTGTGEFDFSQSTSHKDSGTIFPLTMMVFYLGLLYSTGQTDIYPQYWGEMISPKEICLFFIKPWNTKCMESFMFHTLS